MKRLSILAVLAAILLVLNACTNNSPTRQLTHDEQNLLATVVAATLSAANAPTAFTETPPTEIPPSADELSINGQLQGVLAFIRNDNLWVSINGMESQLTNDATGRPEFWYSNPQISPDGIKIAYLKNVGYDSTTLIVSDIDGRNPHQIVDVTWVEWSNDSQKIYYPVTNGFDVTTGLETILVKSINLTTGEFQEHGQFGVITGCGGGSSDPADGVSSGENMHNSTGGGSVFDLSPQNDYINHTTTCFGSGLALLDLSIKQDRTLNDNVSGGMISPDGSRIAAISDNNIVVFNISTGGIESTFPASEPPRALMWDVDGKRIVYSTSRLANTLTFDDNVALDVFGGAPVSFMTNISTIWMISLDSGQSTKIIEMEAHDLKPIFTNGQKALVVMVENSNKLFDYISQGNRENLAEYYPSVNLIEVDLTTSSSSILTTNTRQASFLNK